MKNGMGFFTFSGGKKGEPEFREIYVYMGGNPKIGVGPQNSMVYNGKPY